jgi:hypothetical protein
MYRLLLIILSLLTGLGIQKLNAQARSTASITAEVVYPNSAAAESQLSFGHCAPGPEGGQVQLKPNGEISTKGSIIMIDNDYSPARFYITGIQDQAFSISLSEGPTILSHEGSKNTILVHGWDSNPSAHETWKLDDGALDVNVGAVLDVNNMNDNPMGVYTGFYSIIFNYH